MAVQCIDGPNGSGKSTFVFGQSHETHPIVNLRASLQSRGYAVAAETAHEVRQEPVVPPSNESFLKCVVAREYERARRLARDPKMWLCDRGLPGYFAIARQRNVDLSKEYSYMSPRPLYEPIVFLFEPIPTCDLSRPIQGRHVLRTWEERVEDLKLLTNEYRLFGYEPVNVPFFTAEPIENFERRLEFMESRLGIQLQGS